MSDTVAALLELCELHYCEPDEAEDKAAAFLVAHGWAPKIERTEVRFESKTEYRWWVKGSQTLGRSQALWQEGREVFEAAKAQLNPDPASFVNQSDAPTAIEPTRREG